MTTPRPTVAKSQDAAEALAGVRAARLRIIDSMKNYPPIYDVLTGLVCGGFVVLQGAPDPWPLFSVPVMLLFAFKAQEWWKKRFGWWVNSYAPKKARWVAIAMVAVLIVLMLASRFTHEMSAPWWLPWLMGAIAAPVMILGGRLWGRIWIKELESEA